MVCIPRARPQGSVPDQSTVSAWQCLSCVVLPELSSRLVETLPHSAAAPAYTSNQCVSKGSLQRQWHKKTEERTGKPRFIWRGKQETEGFIMTTHTHYGHSSAKQKISTNNLTVLTRTKCTSQYLSWFAMSIFCSWWAFLAQLNTRRICHTLMTSASLIRHGTASSLVQKRLISSTLSFPGEPVPSLLTAVRIHAYNCQSVYSISVSQNCNHSLLSEIYISGKNHSVAWLTELRFYILLDTK